MAGKTKKAARKHAVEKKGSGKAGRHAAASPGRAAGLAAELAHQPQLVVGALATLGAGLVTRRGDLTRGGARMLAATVVTGAIRSRISASRPQPGSTAPAVDGAAATGSNILSEVATGALIGWLAEALVSGVFDRIEPVVERMIASRRPVMNRRLEPSPEPMRSEPVERPVAQRR